ncbi:MAG TPA: S41 family peptidase, partial [Fibrobacteraceae bacterium]|nr:S41 family peptidase [Fibrobacteraceae bacterium]
RFVRSSIKDGGSLLELQRALDSTQGMGTRVLDLRDNPGGEVSVCEAMADEFLSAQPMIYRIYHSFDSRGQARVDTLIDSAGDGGAAEGEQVILAVDSGTASCAEIFAAALRDNQEKPALLVGTHTYGKGIGQSHWATPAGGMAVITSLQFQTLEGIAYHGTGLLPDVEASDAAMISTAVALAQTNSVVARHNIEKTFANAVPGFVLWSESLDRAVVGGAWIDGDFGL